MQHIHTFASHSSPQHHRRHPRHQERLRRRSRLQWCCEVAWHRGQARKARGQSGKLRFGEGEHSRLLSIVFACLFPPLSQKLAEPCSCIESTGRLTTASARRAVSSPSGRTHLIGTVVKICRCRDSRCVSIAQRIIRWCSPLSPSMDRVLGGRMTPTSKAVDGRSYSKGMRSCFPSVTRTGRPSSGGAARQSRPLGSPSRLCWICAMTKRRTDSTE